MGAVKKTSQRGRPRKADALTAAERAKRYRDKKRAAKASQTLAHPNDKKQSNELVADDHHHLTQEIALLRQRLAESERVKNDLIGALDVFVDSKRKRQKISAEMFTKLCRFLALVK